MSDLIKNISDAEFKSEVLESNLPVLVDFWAEWCGPCRMVAPVLEEIAGQYATKLKIVKVNVDQNQDTPGQFNVRGIPTLLLFKNGKVVGTQVGALNKSQLASFIDGQLD